MGTSRSVGEFNRKLDLAGTLIENRRRDGVKAAATVAKTVFLGSLRASGVTGSTRISRGVKARYDIKGQRNPTAIIRYTGQAHLLNNPTKPHPITPKGVRGSRRSRRERVLAAQGGRVSFGARSTKKGAKAILVNGQPKAYARHPGTRGLGFYQRAVPIATRLAPKAYHEAAVVQPLVRVFR